MLWLHQNDQFTCFQLTQPWEHAHACRFRLAVDLLSFSFGGGEHPSATQSTLLLKDVSIEDGAEWGMKMEIHMNLLTVK